MITKGKWTFDKHGEHSQWFGNITGHPNPDDPQVIRTILCLTRYCDTDEEQEANARLIAAAPELLEACKNLVRGQLQHPTFGSYVNHAVWVAEQAIANATEE